MKKIIGYIRCSSCNKNIKVQSLQDQEEQVRSYAKQHNLRMDEMMAENEAASMSNRMQLGKLMAKVRKGEINSVMCVSMDRLARNADELASIVKLFKKNGVKVYTLK